MGCLVAAPDRGMIPSARSLESSLPVRKSIPGRIEMRSSPRLGLALSMVFAFGALTVAVAEEEKVALKDVPKAVTDSVKKRFPDAELLSAEKETEDGKTVYELTIKDKKHKIDVT